MENNPFFLKVWRFNALVLALAGCLAVIALLIGLALFTKQFIRDRTRDIERSDVVNVSPYTSGDRQAIQESYDFGSPTVIDGTNTVRLPLYSQQHYAVNAYKGKNANALRNLVFFNIDSEKSRWLLPNNDYLLDVDSIRVAKNNPQSRVAGFIYTVIKADTNNDSHLTFSDNSVIAVSRPDGSDYREIIHSVEKVLSKVRFSDEKMLIAYQQQQKRYLATLDLLTFTVSKTSPLLVIPAAKNAND